MRKRAVDDGPIVQHAGGPGFEPQCSWIGGRDRNGGLRGRLLTGFRIVQGSRQAVVLGLPLTPLRAKLTGVKLLSNE